MRGKKSEQLGSKAGAARVSWAAAVPHEAGRMQWQTPAWRTGGPAERPPSRGLLRIRAGIGPAANQKSPPTALLAAASWCQNVVRPSPAAANHAWRRGVSLCCRPCVNLSSRQWLCRVGRTVTTTRNKVPSSCAHRAGAQYGSVQRRDIDGVRLVDFHYVYPRVKSTESKAPSLGIARHLEPARPVDPGLPYGCLVAVQLQ